METETWRPVVGHPLYEVSSLGRVRSIDRVVKCESGTRIKCGVILKPWVLRTGYLQVQLADRKKYAVHRLVCEAFIPREAGKDWVNHKNGDRADAREVNLEWVTPSVNVKDGYDRGRTSPFAGKTGSAHPTSKAIIATNIRTVEERTFESAMDAVREGFDSGAISRCCSGRNASHRGFRWRFSA